MSADTLTSAEKLSHLRKLMCDPKVVPDGIAAYLMPLADEHQTELLSVENTRLAFLLDLTTLSAFCVVTASHACVWVDRTHQYQAELELDPAWTLMKEGLPGTPSVADWLSEQLPQNSRVGCTPNFMTASSWSSLEELLSRHNIQLVPVKTHLVDLIWVDKPANLDEPIWVYPLQYAGVSWQEKVTSVRSAMKCKNAIAVVIAAMDGVAWLLNLRGSDSPTIPVFYSYAVVTLEKVYLFTGKHKLTSDARKHLGLDKRDSAVHVKPYDEIFSFLKAFSATVGDKKIWVDSAASQAIYSSIQEGVSFIDDSPVTTMKAVKNPTEQRGMKKAQIKESVAYCELLAWMFKEVPKGKVMEWDAAKKSEDLKRKQGSFLSWSFQIFLQSGKNTGIAMYHLTPNRNQKIVRDGVLLLDIGSNFLEGTSDMCRTAHFGTPTPEEKEMYTLNLQTVIRVQTAVFPRGCHGAMLDVIGKEYQWRHGRNFYTGTGHGVGCCLSVSEGPIHLFVDMLPASIGIEAGMVFSNEPVVYINGKVGFRLENLNLTVPSEIKGHNGEEFLKFENLTFVPFQESLIDVGLLTDVELEWLNDYHAQCRSVVGPIIEQQGEIDAYDWLVKNTAPLSR